MNILFVSMTFPDGVTPERGTYNYDLCAALAREHKVTVVAPRSWYEWVSVVRAGRRYEPPLHAAAHGLSVSYPVFWYVPRINPQMLGHSIWQSIRGTIRRNTRTARPDVVVSYWAFPDGAGGLQIAKHFNVPSVVIAGGSDVLLLPKEAGRGPAVRHVLKQTDLITTVSDGLRRATIALGVPENRVKTVRQGINPDVFHPGDQTEARKKLGLSTGGKILVWVGRMVPVKNLDLLLDAMKRLPTSDLVVTLHLIGDGPSRKALTARVEAEGLSQRIKFAGPIGHDRLADWYRAADAVVLSSTSEGLPNVLREGLACGKPFVTTDVGDVGEIARPEFSHVVPSNDPTAFAAAIEDIMNPKYRQAASNYRPRTWDDSGRAFSEVLCDLVQSRVSA